MFAELSIDMPISCELSPAGLAAQLDRAARLGGAVASSTLSSKGVSVAFGPELDRGLLDEFVATERACCSFLTLDYDEQTRVPRIEAVDASGREVARLLTAAFGGAA